MNQWVATTFAKASFPVRRMDFKFTQQTPKFWMGGNRPFTLLMTALSSSFPDGERMFIHAVRHYQKHIKNATLAEDVRAFIGQEAHHGKEHDVLNAFMDAQGLPILNMVETYKQFMERLIGFLSPERLLAHTCAAEHFTALLAEQILSTPEFVERLQSDEAKALWLWHAVEESEHKAVAYDVFQEQVGSYWIRTSEMAALSILFPLFTAVHTLQLLKADGSLGTFAEWKDFLSIALGKHGILKGTLTKYLAYYHPKFHPSQYNTTHLREAAIARLQHFVGDKVYGIKMSA